MTINAEGHFNNLESYLNMAYYALPISNDDVKLKEKVFTQQGDKTYEIRLQYEGKLIALKMDKKNQRGSSEPFFHFLDDTGRPWSKRCDFMLLNFRNRKICAYCFEFKSETITADSIVEQLSSSEAWLKSVNNTLKNYTNKATKLYLSKYVLTSCANPSPYLDTSGRYLRKDSSIRHYNYKDINDMKLHELDNCSVTTIV